MRTPRRLLQSVPATPHRHQNYNQAINAGSALLLVFAFVLIYWNYLFCRRRRRDPPSSVAASFPDPKAELEAIAIVVYSGPRHADDSVADFETENCAICLAEFEIGENVRVLPRCMHVFHVECIDRWLVVRSLQCPVCRDRTIQAPPQAKKTSCSSSVNDTTSSMIVEFASTRAFAGHIPSYI